MDHGEAPRYFLPMTASLNSLEWHAKQEIKENPCLLVKAWTEVGRSCRPEQRQQNVTEMFLSLFCMTRERQEARISGSGGGCFRILMGQPIGMLRWGANG